MLILINVPWYGIFAQPRLLGKLNKFKQRALRILYNDFDGDYKTLLDKSSM